MGEVCIDIFRRGNDLANVIAIFAAVIQALFKIIDLCLQIANTVMHILDIRGSRRCASKLIVEPELKIIDLCVQRTDKVSDLPVVAALRLG